MGVNTHIGYFDQTGTVLKGDMKVMEYLTEYAEKITMADGSVLTPAQLLERFPLSQVPLLHPSGRGIGGREAEALSDPNPVEQSQLPALRRAHKRPGPTDPGHAGGVPP